MKQSGRIALGQTADSDQFHGDFFINKAVAARSVFQFQKFCKGFDSQTVGML